MPSSYPLSVGDFTWDHELIDPRDMSIFQIDRTLFVVNAQTCGANGFGLADEAWGKTLQAPPLREFHGFDPGRERIPDVMTLWKFRHGPERHETGQDANRE